LCGEVEGLEQSRGKERKGAKQSTEKERSKAEHRKENSGRKLDAKVGRTLDTFLS